MAIPISYSRSRTAFTVSIALLFLLSIITVGLYASTLAFISNPIVNVSSVINFHLQSYPVLDVLPQNLNTASSNLALASSVISLAVSSACVTFAVLFWPDGSRTYPLPPVPTLTSALLFNALLSFPSMLYLQIAHLRSSAFDPSYRSSYGQLYDQGTFDPESWACQVSGYANDFPRAQCRNAKAGRVVDILCCIAAIAAAAVGAWALRGQRAAIEKARQDKRMRTEYFLGDNDEVEMH